MRIRAGQPSISDEESSTSEGKSSISTKKLAISARAALGTTLGTDARGGHQETDARGGHQGWMGHAAKVGCQAITPVEPEMCRRLMTCDKVHKH